MSGSNARTGEGWGKQGLGLRRGEHVTVLGERVPKHIDTMRAFLGDPPPGRSALDRRRAEEAAASPAKLGIDWSRMSAAFRREDADEE